MADLSELLDDYQLETVEKLDNGKILYGGVGSGKSRAVMGYYIAKELPRWQKALTEGIFSRTEQKAQQVSNRRGPDVYVITTAKKRNSLDWEREAAYFGIGTQEDATVGGVLHIDSWNNLKNYTDVENAFFIFDEQRLVGSGTWVKSFIKIAKNNRWVLLSATPGDTWMDYIPVFVANGFYRNRTQFKLEHVVYSYYNKYPQIEGYINEIKLESLRNLLLVEMPFVRHTVRHLNWIDVGFDAVWYKKVAYERWNIFDQKPVKDASEKWRLLRRIVNQDPSRLEKVREIMGWHPKLIVFYNFDYELNILLDLAGEILVHQYNGHIHEPIPEGDRWIYLVQYIAGAEAWNCTTTDALIMYSMPDSYKNFEQAQGRIDRRDTPYTDLYYYIFISNAIRDIGNKASLDAKKDFNERIFMRQLELLERSTEDGPR